MNLASGGENQMEAHRSSGERESVCREAYDTPMEAHGRLGVLLHLSSLDDLNSHCWEVASGELECHLWDPEGFVSSLAS